MRIQHNIAALNALNQYNANNTAVSKSLQKLSSGYKINSAADNAAGLAISEKMRGQISGLNQAKDNANDGISLVQTAEGGLSETQSILQRMRELAVQSSNGTYQNATDRENLNLESNQLVAEINRISSSTAFNKINLLDGSLGGGSTGDTVTLKTTDTTSAYVKMNVSGLDVGKTVTFVTDATAHSGTDAAATDGGVVANVGTDGNVTVTMTGDWDGSVGTAHNFTIDDINKALKDAGSSATVTSNQTSFKTGATAVASANNTVATMSKMTTAKFATATQASGYSISFKSGETDLSSVTIQAQANTQTYVPTSTTPASGVDQTTSAVLTLNSNLSYTADEVNTILKQNNADFSVSFTGRQSATDIATGLGVSGGGTVTDGKGVMGASEGITFQIGANGSDAERVSLSIGDMSATGLGVDGVSIATPDDATAAIATIDSAINQVSSTRATLGAMQNRLEHTVNNLSTTSENLTSAESQIRDVDMAEEMMNMTKNNILSQAAQSMLAQANTMPQNVLQLLK